MSVALWPRVPDSDEPHVAAELERQRANAANRGGHVRHLDTDLTGPDDLAVGQARGLFAAAGPVPWLLARQATEVLPGTRPEVPTRWRRR